MDKKGSILSIAIIVIVVIVIIAVIIIGMILLDKKIKKDSQTEELVNMTSLFLMPRDLSNKAPTEGKYLIGTIKDNKTIVLNKGDLTASYNEILVPKNFNLTILCWADNYYLNKLERNEYQSESNSKFTLNCDMQKKGSIKLNHTGQIKTTYDLINLNISAKDYYHKVTICTAWSAGIIDVSLYDDFINCESEWLNTSEKDVYACGEYKEDCEYVEVTRCKKLNSEEVVPKYQNKVDKCFYTGMSLKDEDRIFRFEVRSLDYKNSLDEVNFYVIGENRIFDENDNQIKWVYDETDYQYKIPYTE